MEKPMSASRPALATSILSVALLWSTMAVTQDRPGQDRPVTVGGRPAPELHGVWRSRGYGYIVRFTPDGHDLYNVAGDFCYPNDVDQAKPGLLARIKAALERVRDFALIHILRTKRDPDDMFELYRPFGSGAVAFSNEPGQTRYVFDRLPDLPPACSDQTPWSAPRIAALVAATFADLYPSFQLRGIDWQARTAAAKAALNENSDDEALFKSLQTMLAGIEDPHVELHAEVDGESRELMPGEGPTLRRIRAAVGEKKMDGSEWQPAYQRAVLDVILQGKGYRRANDRLFFGRVGDIGYLNLLSMEGLARWGLRGDRDVLAGALDEAIAAFQGARAVIVDVSYNLGGYDAVSQYVAGRFADSRKLAYTKVAHGAQGVEPQAFDVEPSKQARYVGPVYLLTSDVTVSAGEVFTLYMRVLPNVIQVGGTTRGALSDMIEKPLPNGWSLALAAEIYRDPQGEWYEVRGIPPKVQFEVFPPNDLIGGYTRRVQALMDDIRRGVPVDALGGGRP
jgi:carboxyl-terminal processing protease